MEVTGRSVQVAFEPRRNGRDLLDEAYQRLMCQQAEFHAFVSSVQEGQEFADVEQLVMEVVS